MWGNGGYGQLGNGGIYAINPNPIEITTKLPYGLDQTLPEGSKITQLALGSCYSGAVVETTSNEKTTDQLYMWGYNSDGQLGKGDKLDTKKPIVIGVTARPPVIPVIPIASNLLLYIIIGFISTILILAIILTIYSGIKEK